MRKIEVTQTIYPRLPDIMDEDTLLSIITFDENERSFIFKPKNTEKKYLYALYLKSMDFLGYSFYMPGSIPRLVRLKLAEKLDFPKQLADTLEITPYEKSRIVNEVRNFLNMKPFNKEARIKVEEWLKKEVTNEESELLAVINETIRWFRNMLIELPVFKTVTAIAENAIINADKYFYGQIGKSFEYSDAKKLDELIVSNNGRTYFDLFKDEVRKPSSVTLLEELKRIKLLSGYIFENKIIKTIPRRKLEYFSELGCNYIASELRQLKSDRRRTLLYCYIINRYAQLLDAAAESLIQIWRQISSNAKQHANDYRSKYSEIYDRHDSDFKNIINFICDSPSDGDMVRNIRTYRTPEEYQDIRKEIAHGVNWTECFLSKILDFYTSLRRFLPEWYNTVPMVSTISDDSILQAISFIMKHSNPKDSTLPVNDIPTNFLKLKWKQRALKTNPWDKDKIIIVHKSPYEIGLVEAITSSLRDGRLAIDGARFYAPFTQHLIKREKFLAQFEYYAKKIKYPEKASEYYSSFKEEAEKSLKKFDTQYDEMKKTFRVNKKGHLSYLGSSSTKKTKKKYQTLTKTLQTYIQPVSILEILIDVHRITGFLDVFQPVGRRQNMTDQDRLIGLVSSFYAYGCNCGPTQASQATGVSKKLITYFRRHFISSRQLMEAVSVIINAYSQTTIAQKLKDHPGIFMTDAMHIQTYNDSLTARNYFRNIGTKNILLYQHITPNCLCFFSQALLCGVSEAIYMLKGAANPIFRDNANINICDNAGKNDLIFGMAPMLNIDLWSRLNSRQNLKLFKMSKDSIYTNICKAIGGTVNFESIDLGWIDMLWMIASIDEGVADPSLIADYLRVMKNHPATKGFIELGKIFRTNYMIRYGFDLTLRQIVMRYTARRETWNHFGRNVFHGFGGLMREKSHEKQEEIFWYLTVVQNAIVYWNALALDQAIYKSQKDGVKITDEDLKHVLPIMLEHINFVGQFDLDLKRKPPFNIRLAA